MSKQLSVVLRLSPSNPQVGGKTNKPSSVCFPAEIALLFIYINLGGEGIYRVCSRPLDTGDKDSPLRKATTRKGGGRLLGAAASLHPGRKGDQILVGAGGILIKVWDVLEKEYLMVTTSQKFT